MVCINVPEDIPFPFSYYIKGQDSTRRPKFRLLWPSGQRLQEPGSWQQSWNVDVLSLRRRESKASAKIRKSFKLFESLLPRKWRSRFWQKKLSTPKKVVDAKRRQDFQPDLWPRSFGVWDPSGQQYGVLHMSGRRQKDCLLENAAINPGQRQRHLPRQGSLQFCRSVQTKNMFSCAARLSKLYNAWSKKIPCYCAHNCINPQWVMTLYHKRAALIPDKS